MARSSSILRRRWPSDDVPPAELLPAIRDVVRRADPKVPITEMQMLDEMVDRETASRSMQVRVLSAFRDRRVRVGRVGIQASCRSRCLSVCRDRRPSRAWRAVERHPVDDVWRGVLLAIAGIVPGVLLAYAAGRSMEALLAGVKPTDGVTLATAIALSFLMTVLGTLAPDGARLARRPDHGVAGGVAAGRPDVR